MSTPKKSDELQNQYIGKMMRTKPFDAWKDGHHIYIRGYTAMCIGLSRSGETAFLRDSTGSIIEKPISAIELIKT